MMLWLLVLLAVWGTAGAAPVRDSVPEPGSLTCDTLDPCREVLPGAVRFERPHGKPYAAGYDAEGQRVGWVVLSNDVTDVKGYSGKPMSTLLGMDAEGRITGGRVVHHAEPILLVGIPERALADFVGAYTGFYATDRVAVGQDPTADHSVDAVSGATVTVLAQNQTLMDSVRALAQDVGIIESTVAVPGHFVDGEGPWTWRQLVREGALGHLQIGQAEMGGAGETPFVDLYFGVADAPQVGIALLGERSWRNAMARLEPGEHLFVVMNRGSWSFRGSGFVRGGIFDRFRLEQGLRSQTFRDVDYQHIDSPPARGAPTFAEAGLFVTREGRIDPGMTYSLVFLASQYDGKGGFSREFKAFTTEHRVPRSVYRLDGPDPEQALWMNAWRASGWKVWALGAYLLLTVGVFAGRRFTTARMHRLEQLHTGFLLTSFFGVGLGLHVQPSVTQVLTAVGSALGEWRWSLFLSEPLVFLSWIFIAVVTIAWGRGVFCGWVCPYGALNELAFKAGRWLGLPSYELPDRLHEPARYVRYGVLALLIGVFLYEAELGERLAEIEPFKSTFYVAPWTRHGALFGWWLVLLGGAVVVYRPFCRYLCPLGAALAIPSSIRISGPYRRDFCHQGCRICPRGCEPRAIRPDGTIDPRECLSCMECEANYHDDEVCPPLVKVRREREKRLSAGLVVAEAEEAP